MVPELEEFRADMFETERFIPIDSKIDGLEKGT
jgi:hypothetical protein